jgi:hypothetical protein
MEVSHITVRQDFDTRESDLSRINFYIIHLFKGDVAVKSLPSFSTLIRCFHPTAYG